MRRSGTFKCEIWVAATALARFLVVKYKARVNEEHKKREKSQE